MHAWLWTWTVTIAICLHQSFKPSQAHSSISRQDSLIIFGLGCDIQNSEPKTDNCSWLHDENIHNVILVLSSERFQRAQFNLSCPVKKRAKKHLP